MATLRYAQQPQTNTPPGRLALRRPTVVSTPQEMEEGFSHRPRVCPWKDSDRVVEFVSHTVSTQALGSSRNSIVFRR